ncbi:hypothetical protein ACK4CS_15215 [Enterococcus gallinarum]|uniref:hypothetical protein n=1 Tax=Enterococcus gallinarum TaxID=1353 RepID=UPI00391C0F23
MRIVIQGEEITVTLKTSGRELDTKEIVMAHQLATGNFEALFVDTKEDDPKDNPTTHRVEAVEPRGVSDKTDWIEKGKWVEAEVQCPFCGYYGKTGTKWGNSFTKCPSCSGKIFNKFATGKPGEKNSWGCVYLANEPMVFKNTLEQEWELFAGKDEEKTE